jgi:flavin-dependent dehydrogenase
VKRVDVVIIGGSLAGAACASELTRRGIDAVAFERDRFPREKVCGGFLSPGAVDLLDELGVLDALRAAGATTVRSSRIRIGGREIPVELPRPGLGISRRTLDAVMANHAGVQEGFVRSVRRDGEMFTVQLEGAEVAARVVVDAAGKLSRFSKRRAVPQFGVQFYEAGSRGDVLDFWFFEEGYGGAVTVERGRSNACFLVSKDALRNFESVFARATKFPALATSPGTVLLTQEGKTGGSVPPELSCLVTGPLAYNFLSSDFISIGDAAGMVDPFCGEGMRHALDTGISAAKVIASGLNRGDNYTTIRDRYEQGSATRWRAKRRLGRIIREMLNHPRLTSIGLGLNPQYWFRKLWD